MKLNKLLALKRNRTSVKVGQSFHFSLDVLAMF